MNDFTITFTVAEETPSMILAGIGKRIHSAKDFLDLVRVEKVLFGLSWDTLSHEEMFKIFQYDKEIAYWKYHLKELRLVSETRKQQRDAEEERLR